MSRIEEKFKQLAQQGKKGFVAYICAGDPNLRATFDIVLALENAGVDIVELGIPFSDPLADGVVNQRAAERALKNNVSLANVIDLVAKLREKSQIPIVFFTYVNPLLRYGMEKFISDAAKAGLDGVLALDYPPEEWNNYKQVMDERNLSIITLIAPTSSEERIEKISKLGTGFIYYVSRTGVTGERESMAENVKSMVQKIRLYTDKPIAVGFGISNQDQVRQIQEVADAAVVGSAIVHKIEKFGADPDIASKTAEFVETLIPDP